MDAGADDDTVPEVSHRTCGAYHKSCTSRNHNPMIIIELIVYSFQINACVFQETAGLFIFSIFHWR